MGNISFAFILHSIPRKNELYKLLKWNVFAYAEKLEGESEWEEVRSGHAWADE